MAAMRLKRTLQRNNVKQLAWHARRAARSVPFGLLVCLAALSARSPASPARLRRCLRCRRESLWRPGLQLDQFAVGSDLHEDFLVFIVPFVALAKLIFILTTAARTAIARTAHTQPLRVAGRERGGAAGGRANGPRATGGLLAALQQSLHAERSGTVRGGKNQPLRQRRRAGHRENRMHQLVSAQKGTVALVVGTRAMIARGLRTTGRQKLSRRMNSARRGD